MAERNLDFDRIIDRKNTRCLKYDFAVKRGMPEDVLPLWVADMDLDILLHRRCTDRTRQRRHIRIQ